MEKEVCCLRDRHSWLSLFIHSYLFYLLCGKPPSCLIDGEIDNQKPTPAKVSLENHKSVLISTGAPDGT